MSEAYHLYIISFTVGKEAGLALVAAQDEKSAFQILKNGGSRHCDGYSLLQIRDIGMTANCHYGLLMESFVNAMEAYAAILALASRNIKGDKGDSIWVNMYIDDDFYLHLVETNKAQSDALTEKIGKMQENIDSLTRQNQSLNTRYSEEKALKEVLERDLREAQKKGSNTGLIVAVVILSIILVLSLIL